jgi:hypothetical protein
MGNQAIVKVKELTARERYEMLDDYYLSNGLYDDLRYAVKSIPQWSARCMEIRNPTAAAIEFYPKKLWPGTLPGSMPMDGEETILDCVKQIWKWSNWGAKKQVAARQLALYGDMFLRVSVSKSDPDGKGKAKSVYLQLINPKYVTDFQLDERGVITSLRYDAPQKKDASGAEHTYTEAWDDAGVRKWLDHTKGYKATLDDLGPPNEVNVWSDTVAVDRDGNTIPKKGLGFDFIPWVHAPFCDVWESAAAEQRGLSLTWTCLSKIDAVNLSATELHSRMFRYGKPTWALSANAINKNGQPLPPPEFESKRTNDRKYATTSNSIDTGEDDLWRIPGMATLEPLVPNVNWEAHLKLLAADLQEIKRDLPELYYYDIATAGPESGRALLYRMAPAIDRVIEVRGNAETALIRAQEIALSIGVAYGLFSDIGSYDAGDFEHSFVEREVVMSDPQSLGETAKLYVESGVPVAMAMKKYAHWSDDDVKELDAREAAKAPVPLKGGRMDVGAANMDATMAAAIQAVGKGALDTLTKSGKLDAIVNQARAKMTAKEEVTPDVPA